MTHRPFRIERVALGGLDVSTRLWGDPGASPILMLHGTRDSSATFQFLVDCLVGDWLVVAPDLRGHGRSGRAQSYWFHDFVRDVAALAQHLWGERPVPIVGHSLGGNLAGIYAGLRPARVSHLVSLDGFGPLTDAVPVDPLALLRRGLDGLPDRPVRRYPDIAAMADRLRHANPRLNPYQARWLAEQSSAPDPAGGYRWLYANGYGGTVPSLRSVEEWGRIWSAITAPALWIQSEERRPNAPVRFPEEMARRAAMMPRLERVVLPGTGHNMHHDAPSQTAALIEGFLTR